jgi:dTDP-4-dehydrorhamnose 3,5-epimerase
MDHRPQKDFICRQLSEVLWSNLTEMQITQTGIQGLIVIEPKVFEDSRGYFFESYSKRILDANGVEINFVQDNQARSSYGVIRGLHYQLYPHAQTKLVRVLS